MGKIHYRNGVVLNQASIRYRPKFIVSAFAVIYYTSRRLVRSPGNRGRSQSRIDHNIADDRRRCINVKGGFYRIILRHNNTGRIGRTGQIAAPTAELPALIPHGR